MANTDGIGYVYMRDSKGRALAFKYPPRPECIPSQDGVCMRFGLNKQATVTAENMDETSVSTSRRTRLRFSSLTRKSNNKQQIETRKVSAEERALTRQHKEWDKRKVSTLRAILSTFGGGVLLTGFLRLISDTRMFTTPFLQK